MSFFQASPRSLSVFLLTLVVLTGAGCSRQTSGPTPNTITAYCGTPKPISGARVTVSGTANFENLSLVGCPIGSACPYTVTSLPIKYAEVRVTGSGSDLAQCGETDGNGGFSIDLPQSSGAYTIHVSSRANNSNLQAYVLNDNVDNAFYTVDLTVGTDANQSGLSILAPSGSATARTAGAFNILNELLVANDFLRSNTAAASSVDPVTHLPVGGCANGSYFPNCQPFTVGPLAYAYWSKGVNPAGTSSGVSYYVPGTSSLYILGGIDGAVDGEDSDEFDSSVIIHEYGHFLEEHYGRSDSPGGSHNGNSILDPRLAWSEGWADFFQAAVRGENTYADMKNYTTGYGYYQIYEYLNAVPGHPSEHPTMDIPQAAGEGTYREFSITRALWSVLSTTSFSEIWAVFSGAGSISTAGTTSGFHSGDWHFRNVSLLHKLQAADRASAPAEGFTDWSSEQAAEDQYADLRSYGSPIVSTGSVCASAQILAPDTQFNLHSGDKFYDFVPSYSGAQSMTVTYLTPQAQQIDVDLYVYQETYAYYCQLDAFGICDSLSDVVRRGVLASNTQQETFTPATAQDCLDAQVPAGSCAGYEKATVNLSANLSAGQHYLVNTSAYTLSSGSSPQVYFTLSINGQNQCPQP